MATSVPTKRLAAAILSTDSSFAVNNILSWDAVNNLVAGDFGATGYGVFRNAANTQIEFFTFDPSTIASATITITARGLSYKGGVVDGVATKYNWPANTTLVELGTTAPAFLMDTSTNQTVGGVKNFSSSPIVPAPTTDLQASTKKYVDDTLTGVVGTASASNYGTTKMSTAPAVAGQPISVGDNDSRVPTAGQAAALAGDNTDIAVGSGNKVVTQTGLQKSAESYAASSGSANAYIVALTPIPTSYAAGMVVRFKANFANTGAATVNVNSLGAIAIKKLDGATDLASGDIASGQLVTLTYDGTNFQIGSQIANTTSKLIVAPPTAVTVGNTAAETTIVSQSIPGGTLGTANAIRVRMQITNLTTDNASPQTFTINLKYGATTVAATGGLAPISSAVSSDKGFIEGIITANGATNAQTASVLVMALSAQGGGTQNTVAGAAAGTGAEDSTAAKTLAVSIQWGGANANSTITVNNITIEKLG